MNNLNCTPLLNKQPKSRNTSVDLIKAFAIIMMVWGHCIEYGSGALFIERKLFFDVNIFKFIYSFHMPLFMLISGYLFGISVKKYLIKDVFIKKIKSLLVPLFFWSLISFCLWGLSLIHDGNYVLSAFGLVKKFIVIFVSNLWFLWALFWNICIVLVIRHFFKDSLLIYSLVFLLTFFLSDSFNFHLYKWMYPYFVSGYLYRIYTGNRIETVFTTNKRIGWYSLLGLFCLFVLMLSFYNNDSYIYTTQYTIINNGTIDSNQIMIDLYRFLLAL